jgi:hypothetical protein
MLVSRKARAEPISKAKTSREIAHHLWGVVRVPAEKRKPNVQASAEWS